MKRNSYNIKLKARTASKQGKKQSHSTSLNISSEVFHHRSSLERNLPQKITQPTPQHLLSQPQISSNQDSTLFSIKLNRIQMYRNRMSLDFRALHQQNQADHYRRPTQPRRSIFMDREMIERKARIQTQNIYQQQVSKCRQEATLAMQIKGRLELLSKINDQKHALMRSYFMVQK